MALHVGGDAVAGAQRTVGEAHDSNGLGAFQQFGDFVSGCSHKSIL